MWDFLAYHKWVVLWGGQILLNVELCEVLQIQERLFCSISNVALSRWLRSLISVSIARCVFLYQICALPTKAYILQEKYICAENRLIWRWDVSGGLLGGKLWVVGPRARTPTAHRG